MLTRNELKNVWKKHDFRPKKRLGQNFLVDNNIADKVLRHVKLDRQDIVMEIGSGFFELTLPLASRAGRVLAIEKDTKLLETVKANMEIPENITLINKDFLDINISESAKEKRIVVYGNLPYYITSPILAKLFEEITHIKDIYLIVQLEVAERINASPGSKRMGRLSLYAQYHTKPQVLFKIGKNSFYPAPSVDSVFMRLEARSEAPVEAKNKDFMFSVIKAAYSERRKTMRNSLAKLGLEKARIEKALSDSGINISARPESLGLIEFARLSNKIAELETI